MHDLWNRLVSPSGFMPRGHCYLWVPELVWLHVLSDGLIALAYVSIPVTLLVIARKRRDVPYGWMFFSFAVFIVSCGMTHVIEIWTVWYPAYWVAGIVKAITAAASLTTAAMLAWLVPKALMIPTSSALRESEARFRAVLEGSLDAFSIVRAVGSGATTDFEYVAVNERAAAHLGRTRADLVGKRMGVLLGIDCALPCGLIVNELVTNALKHAFPNGRGGTVRVTLASVDEKLELVVADDGCGALTKLDIARPRSLGMQLVASLVSQLEGTVRFADAPGLRCVARFSVPGEKWKAQK